jgi:hypothetical protein
VEAGGPPRIDTTVAHSARVHDYWLGGKDNFAADRAAGDADYDPVVLQHARALLTSGPRGTVNYLALSQVASDIEPERMPEAARQYNSRARETQRHRTHAEVTRFFDGLELLEPGVVVVPQWRPQSTAAAEAHSGMWGGVGRRA